METTWDAIVAVKMHADVPRAPGAKFFDGIEESAADVERDALADVIEAQGVERRLAVRCADAVFAAQRKKDEEVVGGVVGGLFEKTAALEALRVMAIKLVQAPRPRFSAGCFLLAAGIDYSGIRSQRQWAERQRMSPEQASNEVSEWQRTLGLPRTKDQKSERALSIYKQTNGRIKRS